MLHTRDAHALYEKFGFGPNERLMERGALARRAAATRAVKCPRSWSVPRSQTGVGGHDRRVDGAVADRQAERVRLRLARPVGLLAAARHVGREARVGRRGVARLQVDARRRRLPGLAGL